MHIIIQNLSDVAVRSLLEQTSQLYTPPLNEKLDLGQYSDKLSRHANFVLCRQDEETLGYVAFYKNRELREFYVPLICVKQQYQRMGLASKMLSALEKSPGGGSTSYA